MKRFVVFMGLLFFMSWKILNSQPVSFFKEDLTFRIQNASFYVHGEYYLRNNTSQQIQTFYLFYPFPVDTFNYTTADSFNIYDVLKNQQIIPFWISPKGLAFSVSIDSVCILHISYRQGLKCNKARYILTTTEGWHKLLETATYRLITGNDITMQSFSFLPDQKNVIDGQSIYYWKKLQFMPDREMDFGFERNVK